MKLTRLIYVNIFVGNVFLVAVNDNYYAVWWPVDVINKWPFFWA